MSKARKPPEWSKELAKELHDKIFSHEKYDEHRPKWWFRYLSDPPMCGHKERIRFTFFPEEDDENNFLGCEKKATWWIPISDLAFCDEHIEGLWKETLITAWKRLRLELIYVRLANRFRI